MNNHNLQKQNYLYGQNFALQKAYIEIRGATGGDEAKIWGLDLLRMYMRFAGRKGWKISQVDEKTLMITGNGVFELLKKESGVHRVQRVTKTEKRGRREFSLRLLTRISEKAAEVQQYLDTLKHVELIHEARLPTLT